MAICYLLAQLHCGKFILQAEVIRVAILAYSNAVQVEMSVGSALAADSGLENSGKSLAQNPGDDGEV